MYPFIPEYSGPTTFTTRLIQIKNIQMDYNQTIDQKKAGGSYRSHATHLQRTFWQAKENCIQNIKGHIPTSPSYLLKPGFHMKRDFGWFKENDYKFKNYKYNWTEEEIELLTEYLTSGQADIHTANPYYYISHYVLELSKTEQEVREYMRDHWMNPTYDEED